MLQGNRTACAILTLILACTAGANATARPKLKVAPDGFPTGQTTPEGAASDLARAFMQQDGKLFQNVCIPPYGAGQSRADYTAYLAGVIDHFKQQKEHAPSPDIPVKITKVFAARHLSKEGPASYGYASFDFQDLMFVDVEVLLGSGKLHLRRTLVIEDRDRKWYALPVPDVSPLLSDGLYDQSSSVQPFSDIYSVEN
jgi:hypothetical protein